MVRRIGAVVAGLLVVVVIVTALQAVGSSLHPLPEGLDPMDPADADAFAEHLASMPAISWALAFGSELLGAFLGALAAGWIAKDRPRVVSAIVIGFAVLGSIYNWTSFDHPLWFITGQLVGYPLLLVSAWAVLDRRGGLQEARASG